MNERVNKSFRSSNTNKIPTLTTSNVGIVIDIILNDNHIRLEETDSELYSTGLNTSKVGWCVIRPLYDTNSSEMDLSLYPPYDSLSIDIPLNGEVVELIKVGNVTYYKRITRGELNLGNVIENYNKSVFSETEKENVGSSDYSKTSQTGITNSKGNSDRDTKIGEYFEPNPVNRLKLYEGDKIIQSRFGQSIRFSGYNNAENKYSPSILIRNRQSSVSLNELKEGDLTEEDINRDGSTIAMTSGKYKLTFQPGTVDDGGSTNFETKPEHFEQYPSELTGYDQMLLSSERIIISSKSSEFIVYSKGNWGFISDGIMSIDNGKGGANLDFNGDVRLTTNDFNTYILGDKGYIYLNTEETKEPLARGQTLIDIMGEIIDAINQQVYSTPSGPTLVGPNNKSDFSKIKAKLKEILSSKNFTE